MKSLELACLIIALVVFADVGFLLLSNSNNSTSNLRSLARSTGTGNQICRWSKGA